MQINLPSFISGGNHVPNVHDHQFSIGGEAIPVVAKYKYLGCVIDEYPDLNAMVKDRAEAGRRALDFLLRGAQSTAGMLYIIWLHLQEAVGLHGEFCTPLWRGSLGLP